MAALARTFGAVSMIGALAPGLIATLQHAPLSHHNVVPDMNAVPLIEPNRHAVTPVMDKAQDMQAGIVQTLKQAQSEVFKTCFEQEHNPAALFPKAMMSTETDILSDLAIPGAMGNIFTMREALLDRAKTPDRDQALEDLERSLREKSTPDAHGNMASALNWNAFFDQGHSLTDLMAVDPNNPSPDLIPEMKQIAQTLMEGRDVLSSLALTEQKLNKGEVPNLASFVPPISASEIIFFSAANIEMPSITVPTDAPPLASCVETDEMLKRNKKPDSALDIPPPVVAMAPPSLPAPTGSFFG
ncbi:MAG: hypothetical protein L6Q57_05040 [Alphaproteobacteria bacterium]|nr:hypothetical protein [Alphaproteobacteria bacterium]